MKYVHDAALRADRSPENSLRVLPPSETPAHPREMDGNALIAATVEVRGLEHLYSSRYLRLTVVALVLATVTASAAVYWKNNIRQSLGMNAGTAFQGLMQPMAEIKVTSLEPGIVTAVIAHVGDSVKVGDVLVKMDSRDAQESIARAKLAYNTNLQELDNLRGQLAQTEVEVSAASRAVSLIPARQVRDSVQHARAVYEEALIDYQRNQALFEAGVISGQMLEHSATALHIAKDDLENAQKGDTASEELQHMKGQQAELLSQISTREKARQIREARLALDIANRRLADADVRATSQGIVSAVSVKVGDQVSVGAPLAVISRTDRITVNVPISARIISWLHKSQEAQITLPTTPPQRVVGTVRAISPIPSANMTHNVEVEFDNPTGQLLVGQPAEVRFIFR